MTEQPPGQPPAQAPGQPPVHPAPYGPPHYPVPGYPPPAYPPVTQPVAYPPAQPLASYPPPVPYAPVGQPPPPALRPAFPHPEPREHHEMYRTWTYHWWRPVVGIVTIPIAMTTAKTPSTGAGSMRTNPSSSRPTTHAAS